MWAIGYCNKLSIKEDLAPAYTVSGITDWESLAYSDIPASSDSAWNAATCNFEANGYRLPTEANFARYSHDGHCDLPVFYSAQPHGDSPAANLEDSPMANFYEILLRKTRWRVLGSNEFLAWNVLLSRAQSNQPSGAVRFFAENSDKPPELK